ncbi:hypothetical protein HYH02_001370 [Chlamydomonas schloesseri]|nr:hypothetical protein HYH02_001370 [Chlamydomonas schloesseri]|eukprot:KAG2454344.1 hypothetical protein HYH02_001370 [Chlamydomonas schloesseri]
MTGAQHSAQHHTTPVTYLLPYRGNKQQTGDQLKEATMGGQHGTESAATKAHHSMQEATQSTGHRADETAEKAKHGLGIHG